MILRAFLFATLIAVTAACSSSVPDTRKAQPGGQTAHAGLDSAETGTTENPAVPAKEETGNGQPGNYSADFLENLEDLRKSFSIRLDGDKLIADGDTVLFPELPKKNEPLQFTGRKGDLVVSLIVERVNYSSVSYKLELVEFGKANHTSEGIASINAGFFLGSESDESSFTGMGYLCDEYIANTKGCSTHIRIGRESDEPKGRILGKVESNCNGKLKAITLDNFPTMLTK